MSCYLESLVVLPGTLAKRGSLPSGTRGGITSKAVEATTFVIMQAWIPQKRVIIVRCSGLQAAKLEWVSHSSATPANLPARPSVSCMHTAFRAHIQLANDKSVALRAVALIQGEAGYKLPTVTVLLIWLQYQHKT